MEKHEQLYKDYMEFIEKLKNEWDEKANVAKEHGDTENFIKGQIKCNIADVCGKIFNAKYKRIYKDE